MVQPDTSLISPTAKMDNPLENQAHVAQIQQANAATQGQTLENQQTQSNMMEKRIVNDVVNKAPRLANGDVDWEATVGQLYKTPGVSIDTVNQIEKTQAPQMREAKINAALVGAFDPQTGGYDNNKVMIALNGIDPALGFETHKTLMDNQKEALDWHFSGLSRAAGLLDKTTTADGYHSAVALARQFGVGENDLPMKYDPAAKQTFVNQYKDPALAQQQFENKMEERKVAAEEKKAYADLIAAKNKPGNTGIVENGVRTEQIGNGTAKYPAYMQTKEAEDRWLKLDQYSNALRQSSRSALGQSGIANARAGRAIDILTSKDITQDPYVFDLVNTDIQGVMKGAAPDEVQLKGKYSNLQTALASLWAKTTSKPVEINQPGVKSQLLSILKGLRDIDNNVIDKNLGVSKVTFKPILVADPDRATSFYEAMAATKDVNTKDGETIPSYTSVDEAEKAGHKPGDKVIINGVSGTLK